MGLGNKESYTAWQDFIRSIQGRGLQAPVLVTTDGAPGLIRAVEEAWPNSLRQRCLAHKIRNVIGKVPDDTQAELKAMVHSAYYAPNREVAEMIAKDLLERYQDQYPSAMKSFTNDLEACWSYMRCPAVHHKRIRTTNLLERAFVEQKRRTIAKHQALREDHPWLLDREELFACPGQQAREIGLRNTVAGQSTMARGSDE